MHTKVVYQAAKALARIGCAVLRFNFRGVGRSAGTFDDGRGEMDDFRAALDFMAARYPGRAALGGGHVVRLVDRADRRRRRRARVARCIGIAPPVDRYDFDAGRSVSTKPKFFIHGERDELIPLKDDARVLRAAPGAEGAGRHRRRRSPVRRQDVSEVGDALEDLLADWSARHEEQTMQDAVIVSAVRTAVGKAPNGTLRVTRPDELAAAVDRRSAAPRAGARSRGRSTT